MSKINDLIKELCPNGVEFYKLSEIGEIFTGLSGKSKNDFENGNCRYITYTNIYNNSSVKLNLDDYVKVDDKEKQNDIKYKDILIAGSSEKLEDSGMISVVTEEPQEKIYLNSFCFGLRLNDDFYKKYNEHFLKHLFRNDVFRNEIVSCSFGVTRYNLSKNKFLKIKIPCPPIAVQEEIVKILDKFVALEAELEAELEERKKQYEFWRGKLFKSDIDKMITLEDIGDVTKLAGFEFSEYVNYSDSGKIIALRGLNIKNGHLILEDVKYVDNSDFSKLNRSKLYKNDILYTYVGTVGQVGLVDKDDKYYLAPNVARIRIKNKNINSKYVMHFLLTNEFKAKQLDALSGTSSMKNITMTNIRKFKIPVPSLEEQNKIVNILDKFDKLVNDISQGLPAEIELRRKQYEYYRNKLLSFEELKAND